MQNMEVEAAKVLAAMVAATPSCQSPLKHPHDMTVAKAVKIESDTSIITRMANLFLDNHNSGRATTLEDLERENFMPGELAELYPQAKLIANTAIRKVEDRGFRIKRVKAGSSRFSIVAPPAPPKPKHNQTEL